MDPQSSDPEGEYVELDAQPTQPPQVSDDVQAERTRIRERIEREWPAQHRSSFYRTVMDAVDDEPEA